MNRSRTTPQNQLMKSRKKFDMIAHTGEVFEDLGHQNCTALKWMILISVINLMALFFLQLFEIY